MLYHILYPLHTVYSWLNVFKYQTFRAMLAFLIAFFFVLAVEPFLIKYLKKIGKGQPIREEGPKNHLSKQGTPTMGGAVIVLGVIVSALLLADLTNFYVWVSLIVFFALAVLGFVDDFRKLSNVTSKGLSAKEKLFWQTVIGLASAAALRAYGFEPVLTIPFFKEVEINLGVWFYPLMTLFVVGISNAVNLTDGLDGLAIGPAMTVAATYALFAYLSGHSRLAAYLGIYHISGAGELSIVLSALVAAGLGFLWYNTFPAQIFMGDIGALAIGGLLAVIAVIVKQEVVFLLCGGIFVLEAVSVIVQVVSFKLTGKRVFKMAPIHHHFELKGWAEPKIIVRFWIISIVLALFS
ncbi:MAG: phospho-N-acetylmuramoyl-pentapeptide-transferase, partial [Candidatus Dadabacteria bacterium]